MHPTVDEQLRAVNRLLDQVTDDPDLGEQSRELVVSAQRQLRRIERSADARLAFLLDDNRACAELLTSRPGDTTGNDPLVRAAIDALDQAEPPGVRSETEAHETNKALRSELAQAARHLGDGPDEFAWRAALADHLRRRVAADPATNRQPAAASTTTATNPTA